MFACISTHDFRKIVLSIFFLLFRAQILLSSSTVSFGCIFIKHAFAIFKGKYLELRKFWKEDNNDRY